MDYITEEKKKELIAELEDLRGPARKKLLETLAHAKSLGDLKENAEYHQAREDQGRLEHRIKQIEKILETALIIVPTSGDTVEMGSKVTVRKEGSDTDIEYTIVGQEESDMSSGKLSNRSPFGEALLGHKKDDEITFETPRGKVNYKIINVA